MTAPGLCPPRTIWRAPFRSVTSVSGTHATGCSVRSAPGLRYAVSWCHGTVIRVVRGVLERMFQIGCPAMSGPISSSTMSRSFGDDQSSRSPGRRSPRWVTQIAAPGHSASSAASRVPNPWSAWRSRMRPAAWRRRASSSTIAAMSSITGCTSSRDRRFSTMRNPSSKYRSTCSRSSLTIPPPPPPASRTALPEVLRTPRRGSRSPARACGGTRPRACPGGGREAKDPPRRAVQGAIPPAR